MGNFLLKKFEEQNKFVTLSFIGEFQPNSAFILLGEIDQLLAEGKIFQIWDFARMSHMHPEALQYFIEPLKQCCQAKGAVYFLNMPKSMEDLFSKSGLNKLRNQIHSREEAKREPMNWLPKTLEESLLQSLQTLIVRKNVPPPSPKASSSPPGKSPFPPPAAPKKATFDMESVFQKHSLQSIEATIDVPPEKFVPSYSPPLATHSKTALPSKIPAKAPLKNTTTPPAASSSSPEIRLSMGKNSSISSEKYNERFTQSTDHLEAEELSSIDSEMEFEEIADIELEEPPIEEKKSSTSLEKDLSKKYQTNYAEATINIPEEEMSRLSTVQQTHVKDQEEKTLLAPEPDENSENSATDSSSSPKNLEHEPLSTSDLVSIKTETNFVIQEKIASGGMGKVYKAKLTSCDGFEKTVAIKTILPEFCSDSKFIKMFINEAKLVSDLVHDNIVQIYQLGQFEKGYFITMEYIDGKDLSQFRKRHQKMNRELPLEITIFIISRICRALDYAHTKSDRRGNSLNIIHRDISPQNIMMTRGGVVKLTDFGIVKAKSVAASAKKQLAGKFQYMSPEVAKFGEVDHRADLYSLGAVFYELLTNQLPVPINPENLNETLKKIVEHPIIPPQQLNPKISPEMNQFIMNCLEKLPTRRYQNAKVMLDYLEKYLYSGGYGPTNNTLSDYLRDLFQDLKFEQVETSEAEELSEISFASLAMKQGYINHDQVRECLILQGTLAAEKGKRESVGSILVQKKYINLDQLLYILQLQKIRVYKCSTCGNQYNIVAAHQDKHYPCKRCESTLLLVTHLTSAACDGQVNG
ncbi:MAG: protein kinase [Planctomycetota bacterium]